MMGRRIEITESEKERIRFLHEQKKGEDDGWSKLNPIPYIKSAYNKITGYIDFQRDVQKLLENKDFQTGFKLVLDNALNHPHYKNVELANESGEFDTKIYPVKKIKYTFTLTLLNMEFDSIEAGSFPFYDNIIKGRARLKSLFTIEIMGKKREYPFDVYVKTKNIFSISKQENGTHTIEVKKPILTIHTNRLYNKKTGGYLQVVDNELKFYLGTFLGIDFGTLTFFNIMDKYGDLIYQKLKKITITLSQSDLQNISMGKIPANINNYVKYS